LSGIIPGAVSFVNPTDLAIYIDVLLLMLALTGTAYFVLARGAFDVVSRFPFHVHPGELTRS
jgi:hypothetical protein